MEWNNKPFLLTISISHPTTHSLEWIRSAKKREMKDCTSIQRYFPKYLTLSFMHWDQWLNHITYHKPIQFSKNIFNPISFTSSCQLWLAWRNQVGKCNVIMPRSDKKEVTCKKQSIASYLILALPSVHLNLFDCWIMPDTTCKYLAVSHCCTDHL